MASIHAFRLAHKSLNWSNEELAELFRVVDILGRAGIAIDTDMGQTDEGEPWFAFCRADTGDVIVHFSRIDGQFVAVSAATDAVVRGDNFRRVAEALVNRQPLVLPTPASGQKLFLHPAVMLTALVATTLAQMKSWDGQEISALDDTGAAPGAAVSGTSFAETLKTAFVDALNMVLRGFMPPADARILAEAGQTGQGMGLGLGNLSLASVVAFAISAIQDKPEPDETGLAETSAVQSPEASDADAKSIAMAGANLPASEQKSEADAQSIAATAESAPLKTAPVRDGALVMDKMDNAGGSVQKLAAMAMPDDKAPPAAQQPVLDKLTVVEISNDAAHQKVEAAAPRPDAAKAVPALPAASPAHLELAPVKVILLSANATVHQFTFSEISRDAIEIFFGGRESDASGPGVLRLLGDLESGGRAFPAGLASGDGKTTGIFTAGMPPGATEDGFSVSLAARTPLRASDIVFAGGDPVAMARLDMITDFINSADSVIRTENNFQNILEPFWSGDKPLTLVVFDSEDLPLNFFSFTSNVLFVEESRLAGAAIDFGTNPLQVDLASGGDVTLLGVINLNPLMGA